MDKDTKKEFQKVNKDFAGIKQDFADLKQDVKSIKSSLGTFATKEDIRKLAHDSLEVFATRPELEELKVWAQETFVTKEYFDTFTPLFEEIMEEIKENRYERAVYFHRYELLRDKVTDHDKRIGVLEHKK